MSGPADRFEAETDAVSDVRLAGPGEYLHEYTGVLAETGERVRILAIPLELAELDAAVDAFAQVSDRWYNASANANILTIRDRGSEPRPWVAVPDHGGDTLATLQPDLSPETIETIISETADALRTLGLYNTVHGHLSPDDIYLPDAAEKTETLSVHVGGFGLEAAIQAAVGEFEPTAYTAPELLDNPNQSTEQTDVYILGAITYFALTGSPPVEAADLDQSIRDGCSVPPSAYDDAIPAEFDDVVMQALSPSPNDRYDSPYAFGRAFLSTFDPDDFRPDDTGKDSEDEAESTGDDDDSLSDEDDSVDSADTDETSMTRRAAVGLLGVGVLGGAGWYVSRGQLTVPNLQKSVSEQWSYQTEAAVYSSPAVVDGTVYVGSMDNNVYALSADDGTEQWSYQTEGRVSSSPAVVNGTVYVGSWDSSVYALSAADGTMRWSHQTEDLVVSSPAVAEGTVYVGSADNTVYALSATDGTVQWTHQTGDAVESSPAVAEGTVYVGSGDGSLYALSANGGTEQWSRANVSSSPAVADSTVYVASDKLYALSADDGTEQWTYQTTGSVDSSPEVADSTVYIGSTDNNVYALSADDGTEQWAYQAGSGVYSSPTVVDSTGYVGGENSSVYAFSADDGTEQWSYDTGSGVFLSPAVVKSTVYVGNEDGNVYALSEE